MNRAPVELDERKAIPKIWKEAARAKSGEVCAYPECETAAGLEYDHILALKLGGKHRLDNIQALCGPHHLQKTRLDVKMIAKAKAQAGETGQYARRQKRGGGSIPSRKTNWPKRPLSAASGARSRRDEAAASSGMNQKTPTREA